MRETADATTILKQAKRIASEYSTTPSKNLLAVHDSFSGTTIPNWRADGQAANQPLHKMMSRVGGFPPALARYFVAAYSKPDGVVLDPFCGKGTALFEAATLRRVAIGGDIAPDAVIASRAKCAGVSVSQVANYIERLPSTGEARVSGVPENVALFFHRHTLRQILRIRQRLLADISSRSDSTKKRVATFVCGVMLGILHGHSRLSLSLPCNQCFAMSPDYVRRYVKENGLKKPRRDVKACLLERALELLPAPKEIGTARVYLASAQTCGGYMRRLGLQADLVLTSPPYLNRQTYIKDAWLRFWFLGSDRLSLAKKSFETGNVVAFVDAMTRSLLSIWDAMRSGGRLVLVCGKARVNVRKKKRLAHVCNLCLLAASRVEAEGKAFQVERLLGDRVLMKRGSYFAVHHGRTHKANGETSRRYGEDEILIMRKRRA